MSPKQIALAPYNRKGMNYCYIQHERLSNAVCPVKEANLQKLVLYDSIHMIFCKGKTTDQGAGCQMLE